MQNSLELIFPRPSASGWRMVAEAEIGTGPTERETSACTSEHSLQDADAVVLLRWIALQINLHLRRFRPGELTNLIRIRAKSHFTTFVES